ncbi:class I SAM-dependent methyltransferase [soil metagenome]
MGTDFAWHLDAVPERLTDLLDGGEVPSGPAVDLGCGDGVVAAHLAERMHPTIGLDLAFGAAHQGQHRAAVARAAASFGVSDAAALPLRDRSVALVFDRGCLQNMPRGDWPAYFAEVQRVLLPDGVLLLFCSRAVKAPIAPLASRRGIKARLKWALGRRAGPQFASVEAIRELTPPSLHVERLGEAPMRTRFGNERLEIQGTFRRAR